MALSNIFSQAVQAFTPKISARVLLLSSPTPVYPLQKLPLSEPRCKLWFYTWFYTWGFDPATASDLAHWRVHRQRSLATCLRQDFQPALQTTPFGTSAPNPGILASADVKIRSIAFSSGPDSRALGCGPDSRALGCDPHSRALWPRLLPAPLARIPQASQPPALPGVRMLPSGSEVLRSPPHPPPVLTLLETRPAPTRGVQHHVHYRTQQTQHHIRHYSDVHFGWTARACSFILLIRPARSSLPTEFFPEPFFAVRASRLRQDCARCRFYYRFLSFSLFFVVGAHHGSRVCFPHLSPARFIVDSGDDRFHVCRVVV